eukprot:4002933-Ditylum_brightwellii.AAC.1
MVLQKDKDQKNTSLQQEKALLQVAKIKTTIAKIKREQELTLSGMERERSRLIKNHNTAIIVEKKEKAQA